MKNNVIIILVFVLVSSCSLKKVSVTSNNSRRGDAVFSRIVPYNNYGKLEDIHIYCWTQNGELNVNRVLIDFNLDKIPSSAIIDSAFLSLYFNPTSAYNKDGKGNQGQDSIIIQRVTSDWNENDVTWNKQPETTKVNQLVIPKTKSTFTDYVNIDVTYLIQDIVKDDKGRYGIMIRHQNEKPYNVVFFASGNNPKKNLHPELSVYYRKK
ncbi:MAG: DNRLRE domain-containing protein [Reichenbachiella sp.]